MIKFFFPKWKGIIALLCVLMFVVSCSNDDSGDGTVYATIGTYQKAGLQAYFILDDSMSLITTNTLAISDSLIGSRFFLEFQKVEPKDENPNYDYTVNLLSIQQSQEKPILILSTKSEIDTIGTAPILPSWVWASADYLNIVFYVKGTPSVTHKVNLIENLYDPIQVSADTLILELRHNSNSDYPYQNLRGVNSFDLTPFDSLSQNGVLKMLVYYSSYYQGLSSIYIEYDQNEKQVVNFSNMKNVNRVSALKHSPMLSD